MNIDNFHNYNLKVLTYNICRPASNNESRHLQKIASAMAMDNNRRKRNPKNTKKNLTQISAPQRTRPLRQSIQLHTRTLLKTIIPPICDRILVGLS